MGAPLREPTAAPHRPDAPVWKLPTRIAHESVSVEPSFLGGKYPKWLLTDGSGISFLFKTYREEEWLAAVAEIAAAALRALILRESTVEVREFEWNGMHGTIQRLVHPSRPLTEREVLASPELGLAVLSEHPIDWALANHDAHAEHCLLVDESYVVFVDKGQSFRFAMVDRLDLDYNPNAPTGREPPIYTPLYERFSGELNDLPPTCSAVVAADEVKYREILERFAQAKFDKRVAAEAFVTCMMARKATVIEDFGTLYGRLRSLG